MQLGGILNETDPRYATHLGIIRHLHVLHYTTTCPKLGLLLRIHVVCFIPISSPRLAINTEDARISDPTHILHPDGFTAFATLVISWRSPAKSDIESAVKGILE